MQNLAHLVVMEHILGNFQIPRNPGGTECEQTLCTRLFFFLCPHTRTYEQGYMYLLYVSARLLVAYRVWKEAEILLHGLEFPSVRCPKVRTMYDKLDGVSWAP